MFLPAAKCSVETKQEAVVEEIRQLSSSKERGAAKGVAVLAKEKQAKERSPRLDEIRRTWTATVESNSHHSSSFATEENGSEQAARARVLHWVKSERSTDSTWARRSRTQSADRTCPDTKNGKQQQRAN